MSCAVSLTISRQLRMRYELPSLSRTSSTRARLSRSIKFRAFRCRNFRQDTCTLTLMSHTTSTHDASFVLYGSIEPDLHMHILLAIYGYILCVHNIHAHRNTEIHNTPGRIRGLLRDPESEATDYFP